MRHQLEPVFFSPPPTDVANDEMTIADAQLAEVSARLFSLGSSHDVAIGRAFAASVGGQQSDGVASPSFWQSLRRAELLAAHMHTFLISREE